ncbi:MAG TPA: arylsulfotransferase family protein [Solirubrobacteraceae bacterium]|nr:arylsulfotransferase family protein [Solirubrobacteraceae bacterium]
MRISTPALGALACAVVLIACGGSSSSADQSSAPAPPPLARVTSANPLAVSPQPGTPDASPSTQISFLGGPGTIVSGVTVKGSRSGSHSGVLRAYSTGTGESFLASKPFTPGETVSVRAQITGGPATGTVTTSFTIAQQYAPSQKQFPNNPGRASEVQHYASAPSLAPSSVRILTHAKAGATQGDLFLAPYQGKGTAGPMISDQDGNLIWFHPLPSSEAATNFQVQQFGGQPVLTWWQGRILEVGFGQGEDVIFDSSYRQIGRVRAGNGYHADLHEIRLEPDGTAWIDAFDPIRMNLSSLHGRTDGVLTDAVVQHIDVKTGLVMWEWHALGHVPLGDSYSEVPKSNNPWDYIHVNSVDPGANGDVLLSARNTWTLYDVDIRTGAVRWRIGGRHSTFKIGSGAHFYWQHDAEWRPGGLISLFDNGSTPPKEKQSRGLLLEPNEATHAVTLRRAFTNPSRRLLASSQGNTLELPGGDWLMGYGGLPNFTEYDSAGHVLLDGTLGKNVQDFKTFIEPWSGHPSGAPALAAKASGGGLSVAVSWNGATEVASWRVLAGSSASALSPAASAAKRGFETTIAVPGKGPWVKVEALDPQGNAIGASATVKT